MTVPAGLIVAWRGSLSEIPQGWYLCDGQNGRPNLLNRFLKGIPNASTNPGSTGGSSTHSHTSSSAGAHNHGDSTSTGGSHTHIPVETYGAHASEHGTARQGSGYDTITAAATAGSHNHVLERADSHTHTISSSGSHSHTTSTESLNPPYYEVAWIISSENASVAPGLIAFWPKPLSQIPSGWVLDTPLLGRFLKGIPDASTNPGSTGGSNEHTHTVSQASSHTHSISTYSSTHTHSCSTAGSHNHGTATNQAYGSGGWYTSAGGHSHTISSSETSHSHTAGSSGEHTHELTTANHLPPFMELAPIRNNTSSEFQEFIVVAWAGSVLEIPPGWYLANGEIGLPNLLGKFVKCIPDSSTDPGSTGGSQTHTHTFQPSGLHSHSLSFEANQHTHSVGSSSWLHNHGSGSSPTGSLDLMILTNDWGPSHNHGGTTTNPTEMHSHFLSANYSFSGGSICFPPQKNSFRFGSYIFFFYTNSSNYLVYRMIPISGGTPSGELSASHDTLAGATDYTVLAEGDTVVIAYNTGYYSTTSGTSSSAYTRKGVISGSGITWSDPVLVRQAGGYWCFSLTKTSQRYHLALVCYYVSTSRWELFAYYSTDLSSWTQTLNTALDSGSSSRSGVAVSKIPGSTDSVILVLARYSTTSYSYQVWNGSSWSSSTTFYSKSSSTSPINGLFSLVDADNKVHMAYVTSTNGSSLNYGYYTTTWSTPVTISSYTCISPSLTPMDDKLVLTFRSGDTLFAYTMLFSTYSWDKEILLETGLDTHPVNLGGHGSYSLLVSFRASSTIKTSILFISPGAHSHTASSNNLPPFFEVAWIIKIGQAYFQTFTEALRLEETRVSSLSRILSETLVLSEGVSKDTFKPFSEATSLSENFAKTPRKAFTEGLKLEERLGEAFYQAITEALAFGESLTKSLVKIIQTGLKLSERKVLRGFYKLGEKWISPIKYLKTRSRRFTQTSVPARWGDLITYVGSELTITIGVEVSSLDEVQEYLQERETVFQDTVEEYRVKIRRYDIKTYGDLLELELELVEAKD